MSTPANYPNAALTRIHHMYKPLSVLKPRVRASCSGLRIPDSAGQKGAHPTDQSCCQQSCRWSWKPHLCHCSHKGHYLVLKTVMYQARKKHHSAQPNSDFKIHLTPLQGPSYTLLTATSSDEQLLLLSSHRFFLLTIMSIV